jgi:cytochrome c oxidase subunit 2
MRGVIVVDTQEEYDKWLASQKPQFLTAHPDGVPPAAKSAAAEATGTQTPEGKPVAQAEEH